MLCNIFIFNELQSVIFEKNEKFPRENEKFPRENEKFPFFFEKNEKKPREFFFFLVLYILFCGKYSAYGKERPKETRYYLISR